MLKPHLKADAWKTGGRFRILCGRILCVWHRMRNRPNDLKTTSLEHFNSMKHIFPKGDPEHRGICFPPFMVQRKYFLFSPLPLLIFKKTTEKKPCVFSESHHSLLAETTWSSPWLDYREHYGVSISGTLMT